jgi:hypothetical protein
MAVISKKLVQDKQLNPVSVFYIIEYVINWRVSKTQFFFLQK